MDSEDAADSQITHQGFSQLGPVDPGKARFPCCIVWTPIPLISWFIPFVGHIGICREDGVIMDFAGSNFVCVDNFAFGAPARYIQIQREKCDIAACSLAVPDDYDQEVLQKELYMTWDEVLTKSTQEFQKRSYNLFTCNCHSFVANNLNRMRCLGHGKWNVVNLAAYLFMKATWVGKGAFIRTMLPFLLVMCLGPIFGGTMFLVSVVLLSLFLVGWFLFGTYCFKNIIYL